MKLAKLSLAAIVVAGFVSSAFAADSLADAFKNGKVSGQLKAYYFTKKATVSAANAALYGATAGHQSASIFDFGVDLNYVTGSYNGFTAGFTFQGNSAPFANAAGKAMYNGDMYGTGAVLSQGYLEYKNSGAFVKVGRQFISTPLVGVSGSRITKESFEGYVAGYTGIPDTTVVAAYVTKYQHRTDSHGHVSTFQDVGKDNAWTVTATNKSLKGLKVTGAYAAEKSASNLKAWYANVYYKMMLSGGTMVNVGANYYSNSTDKIKSLKSKDGNVYSIMAGAGMSGLYAQVAYGQVSSSSNLTYGIGNGPGDLYNNTIDGMYFNDTTAGVKDLGVKVTYDLSKAGVAGAKVGVGYNKFSGATDSAYADYTVIGANASYKFSGALSGLSTVVKYAVKNVSGGNNGGRFRFYANYKF